jgi:hypothetical protein
MRRTPGLQITAVVCVLNVVIIAVASAILLHDEEVGRAVNVPMILTAVTLTLLVVGFALALSVQTAQQNRRRRRRRFGTWPSNEPVLGEDGDSLSALRGFGFRLVSLVLVAIVAVEVYLSYSAFSGLNAVPGPPTRTCRWPLDEGSDVTCVSHATYMQAGSTVQRFALCVVVGFAAGQFLMLAGTLSTASGRGGL